VEGSFVGLLLCHATSDLYVRSFSSSLRVSAVGRLSFLLADDDLAPLLCGMSCACSWGSVRCLRAIMTTDPAACMKTDARAAHLHESYRQRL